MKFALIGCGYLYAVVQLVLTIMNLQKTNYYSFRKSAEHYEEKYSRFWCRYVISVVLEWCTEHAACLGWK